MSKIQVVHHPAEEQLSRMQVRNWPVWTKEVSEFPWHYDEQEICYFLEGEVTVTPEHGEPVAMGVGDLVTFPQGMSCTWKIHRNVKKHYKI